MNWKNRRTLGASDRDAKLAIRPQSLISSPCFLVPGTGSVDGRLKGHDFTGCGKTQSEDALYQGHGFSRAINVAECVRPSGPAGCFRIFPTRIRPFSAARSVVQEMVNKTAGFSPRRGFLSAKTLMRPLLVPGPSSLVPLPFFPAFNPPPCGTAESPPSAGSAPEPPFPPSAAKEHPSPHLSDRSRAAPQENSARG